MFTQVDQEALRSLVEGSGLLPRQNGRSWRITCPKCGKSKLYIQKKDGRSKCMKCGDDFKGWADFVLAEVLQRPKDELTTFLYGRQAATRSEEPITFVDHWEEWTDDDEILLEEEAPLPGPVFWGPDQITLDRPGAAAAREYLRGRNVSVKLAMMYGVRYDQHARRICFPANVDGIMRGWQGRTIDKCDYYNEDGQEVHIPKVLTVGELAGKVVMGQDRLIGSEHGILVEGPFDMMACHRCRGNTATMGKSYSEAALRIYRRSGIKRLYCGLDDDASERIMKLARDMSSYVELFRLKTPPGREDLGASSPGEVYEEFMTAKRMTTASIFVYFSDNPGGRFC